MPDFGPHAAMGFSPHDSPRHVRFGVFEVDFVSGDVRKRGSSVRLQPQPLRVLELLVARAGDVVAREELRERLWPADTFVDFDHGLNKAVNRLRELLGDSADSPRFIETLPKRGYRFIAPIERLPVSAVAGRATVDGAPTAPPSQASAVAESNRASPAVSSASPEVGALAAAAPGQGALAPVATTAAPSPSTTRRFRRGWIVSSVAAVVAIVASWGLTLWRTTAPTAPAARSVMVVLPFVNLAGDEAQEYFSDGMTDEMIQQLSALMPDRLGVIARTSAMHYKGSRMRVDQIARELGADYVLEGTVRRNGPRVRIAASLMRKDEQTPLWSEAFERDLTGVFEIQSEVARRIAGSLALELVGNGGPRAPGSVSVDSEAYEHYLRGRFQWNTRSPADLDRALSSFESAIARAPNYGPAKAALADALNVLPWYGLRPPREAYPRSKDLALQALTLDDRSAAAHTALAYVHHYFDWDWPAAEREYARALSLNPNYAQARQWFAAHLAEMGRFDSALNEERQAQTLDPRSLVINAAIGWIQYLARRYPEAEQQLQRTLDLDPTFVPAHLWMGQTLEAMGRPTAALEHYLAVRRLAGTAPTGLGELARAYALSGDRESARRALGDLTAAAASRYVEADLFARVYDSLGDRDAALEWLERGVEERAAKMTLLGVDPQYDGLRGNPRFQSIVARLQLPATPAPRH